MAVIKKEQLPETLTSNTTEYVLVIDSDSSVISRMKKSTFEGGVVKKYVALITGAGASAPVSTVFENTFDTVAPVWARLGAGQYTLTFPNEILLNKTFIMLTVGEAGNSTYVATAHRVNNNTIRIDFFLIDGTEAQDDLASGHPSSLEIRMYA